MLRSSRKQSTETRGASLLVLMFCAVCILLAANWYTGGALSNAFRAGIYPLLSRVYTTADSAGSLGAYMASKRALADENVHLRARVEELERLAPQDRLDALDHDAQDTLTETLARFDAGHFAGRTPHIGDIVSYTEYPFGTLGVYFRDTLADTSAGQLRYVFSEDGVVLGTLDTYTARTALVRLFSSPGVEHHMRIGDSEMALVRGMGGITMETDIPKSVDVHEGDPVSLPEAGNTLVGSVGEISSKDTDTTQHILIRLGSVPTHIRTVFLFE